MCSQPIVQAAHDVRATRRAAFSSSPDRASAPSNVPCLEVARRQGVEAVERQQVGDRAQLAVLLGRRAERARATGRCAAATTPAGSATGVRCVPRDSHRLDALRAQHRPSPPRPAWRLSWLMRGERDQPLAGRADDGDVPVRAEPVAQRGPSPRRPAGPRGRPPARSATAAVVDRPATDGARHGAVMTRASTPVRLPARAKCDDERASLSRPVSGDWRRRRTWPRSSAGCRPAG